jgi:hypothetical protein
VILIKRWKHSFRKFFALLLVNNSSCFSIFLQEKIPQTAPVKSGFLNKNFKVIGGFLQVFSCTELAEKAKLKTPNECIGKLSKKFYNAKLVMKKVKIITRNSVRKVKSQIKLSRETIPSKMRHKTPSYFLLTCFSTFCNCNVLMQSSITDIRHSYKYISFSPISLNIFWNWSKLVKSRRKIFQYFIL